MIENRPQSLTVFYFVKIKANRDGTNEDLI